MPSDEGLDSEAVPEIMVVPMSAQPGREAFLRLGCARVGDRVARGQGDLAEWLGHANVGITLDTYSHVLPAADEIVAHTLAKVILGGD